MLVAASDVAIVGEFGADERSIVRWALGRFDDADLRLPPEIHVSFGPAEETCSGWPAICRPARSPPEIGVCEANDALPSQLLAVRMATLHELAHIWHRAQGDGLVWPDHRDIVGGVIDDPDAKWQDRMEERVAVVITWGLLDQLRRPVPTTLSCGELYRQFVALTAHVPLEPIESVCRP